MEKYRINNHNVRMARNENGCTILTITNSIDVSKYGENSNIFTNNFTTSMPAPSRGSSTFFLQ